MWATCPQDGCFPGGGKPSTDCLVEWSGIAASTLTCQDGDPACDTDGVADGTCRLTLGACLNVPSPCAAGSVTQAVVKPATAPAAQALGADLGALVTAGGTAPVCTNAPLPVPVRVTPTRIKPGKVRLVVTATGPAKDVDRLTLICTAPSAPSFQNTILPLIRTHCAVTGCHTPFDRSGNLDLSDTTAYAALVDAPVPLFSTLREVAPGSIKRSYLARKLTGRGRFFGSPMPQGCPLLAPCLTEVETFAFLAWIQGGAPAN